MGMDLLDVLILALRVALVVLLYLFLAFVVRGAVRALKAPRAPEALRPATAARVERTRLRLQVLQPGAADLQAGEQLTIEDGVTLGRGERAGVVLADPA